MIGGSRMDAKEVKPQFARRVTEQLDALPLSGKAQTRLNEMHALALSHAAATQPRLAGASGWLTAHWHAHPAAWASGLVLCLVALFGGVWQMETRDVDTELETMLLSDDVPLDVLANNQILTWSSDSH